MKMKMRKVRINRRIHLVAGVVGNVIQVAVVGETEDDEVEVEDVVESLIACDDCVGHRGNKVLLHSLDSTRILLIREAFAD